MPLHASLSVSVHGLGKIQTAGRFTLKQQSSAVTVNSGLKCQLSQCTLSLCR